MKRFLGIGLMMGALALMAAPQAEAAQMTGAISLSASVLCAGCNPVTPVTNTGVVTTLGAATSLDFSLGLTVTPGLAGRYQVDNANGDFAVLFGTTGALNDFTFSGAGTLNYPSIPVIGFQTSLLNGFSFDILSIVIIQQDNASLTLRGTGLFHMNGFDNTPGIWNFQTNNSGGVFSFAGSESTIPEPGSMILLGTGLLGLATMARRMRKA